jgi:hypothetical protein
VADGQYDAEGVRQVANQTRFVMRELGAIYEGKEMGLILLSDLVRGQFDPTEVAEFKARIVVEYKVDAFAGDIDELFVSFVTRRDAQGYGLPVLVERGSRPGKVHNLGTEITRRAGEEQGTAKLQFDFRVTGNAETFRDIERECRDWWGKSHEGDVRFSFEFHRIESEDRAKESGEDNGEEQ